jgi:Zn-finger DNA-binding domain protein
MLINTDNSDELIQFITSLPFNDFRKIVELYSKTNSTDFDRDIQLMTTLSLQSRLQRIGINSVCPNCKSELKVRNGRRPNGIQEYRCKECGTKYTAFTDTILEKTRWHWDIWIKVLEITINGFSIENMVNVLQDDYGCTDINSKTVWHWRMKLMHAVSTFPVPKLTGVIQIDETFIRESQKGSRRLESYIKNEKRLPRKGKSTSKYGVMGVEFATVTVAVDSRGYSVSRVTGLGKLDKDIFFELFNQHIENPTYICTDANSVYNDYCNLLGIPHYIKPSGYNDILTQNGYYDTEDEEKRELIKLKLYNKGR